MKTETLVAVTVLLAVLLSVGAYQAGVGLAGSQTEKPAAGAPVAAGSDGPALFAANCAGCHGNDLSGGRGPSLFSSNHLASRRVDRSRTPSQAIVADRPTPYASR